jgi:hypothetical protein
MSVSKIKKHNMDLGTTIIGIVCVTLCALPFILTNRSKNKKVKELVKSLKDLAKQNGSEITHYETCGNYAIGIDESKNSISFIVKTDETFKTQFVNLLLIKSCKINNISRSTSNKDQIIDQLNLILSAVDKNTPDVILEFYNSEISYQPYSELESIEKWNNLINNLLNTQKQSKAA